MGAITVRSCFMGALAGLVAGLGATRTQAHDFIAKDLQIVHPHALEPIERLPGKLPIFMMIRNNGDKADRLIAASSSHAKATSLVDPEAPTSTAKQLPAIELPPHSEIVLGPNSTHVLLYDLTEPLEGYEYFPATLTFEIAGQVEIEIMVEDRQ